MTTWPLEDLAGCGDLAREYGVTKPTITNWTTRYSDFPAPLVVLSTGQVYSRRLVRQWHDDREWQPGKHKVRVAAKRVRRRRNSASPDDPKAVR
jgi:hypothetical protein